MKNKNILERIYPEEKKFTQESYKNLVKDKDYDELVNYTHYFVCKFLQDLNVENLEDNISESFLIIYEFVHKKKFAKTLPEYLDNVSKFLIEQLEIRQIKEKACNQDLNYDKRVPLQSIEQEIDSNTDFEDSLSLKMDIKNGLEERADWLSARGTWGCPKHPAAKKHTEIFTELHGICDKKQKSIKALAKKYNVSTQLISKINLTHLRVLRHPHYGLHNYYKNNKEK